MNLHRNITKSYVLNDTNISMLLDLCLELISSHHSSEQDERDYTYEIIANITTTDGVKKEKIPFEDIVSSLNYSYNAPIESLTIYSLGTWPSSNLYFDFEFNKFSYSYEYTENNPSIFELNKNKIIELFNDEIQAPLIYRLSSPLSGCIIPTASSVLILFLKYYNIQ